MQYSDNVALRNKFLILALQVVVRLKSYHSSRDYLFYLKVARPYPSQRRLRKFQWDSVANSAPKTKPSQHLLYTAFGRSAPPLPVMFKYPSVRAKEQQSLFHLTLATNYLVLQNFSHKALLTVTHDYDLLLNPPWKRKPRCPAMRHWRTTRYLLWDLRCARISFLGLRVTGGAGVEGRGGGAAGMGEGGRPLLGLLLGFLSASYSKVRLGLGTGFTVESGELFDGSSWELGLFPGVPGLVEPLPSLSRGGPASPLTPTTPPARLPALTPALPVSSSKAPKVPVFLLPRSTL